MTDNKNAPVVAQPPVELNQKGISVITPNECIFFEKMKELCEKAYQCGVNHQPPFGWETITTTSTPKEVTAVVYDDVARFAEKEGVMDPASLELVLALSLLEMAEYRRGLLAAEEARA